MKLTVLGSGSPEPHLRRASSGYLLEVAGQLILFDCGGGVFDRLLQAGVMPDQLDYLFFTHLHTDHMMDYARLIHARWDMKAPPLKVFGPAPIATINERYFGPEGALAYDLTARTEYPGSKAVWVARGGALPRPWPAPEITEIEPGFELSADGWSLNSCEVPHVQPFLTSIAFSVTSDEGKKLVYPGDSGVCHSLEELARHADFMLHWCYRIEGETLHPKADRSAPTPSEVAAMAQRIGVKQLALSHLRAHMDHEETHKLILEQLGQGFDGPSLIVEDLDVFEI